MSAQKRQQRRAFLTLLKQAVIYIFITILAGTIDLP
jgi:hypothetical protein